MTKILIADRRFSGWSRANRREGWIKIGEYQGKDIVPVFIIPDEVSSHWKANKNELGYATFRGIEKTVLLIVALAKGNKVNLGINRWGGVVGYKIK